jgi:hypothetical protein
MKKDFVLRITVDERLSENIVQLLIAELKSPKKEYHELLSDIWREEKISHIDEDYWAEMIPKRYLRQYPYQDLVEGQVFISGPVEIFGRKKTPIMLLVREEARPKLIEITELVKEDVKRLYKDALQGKTNSRNK